MRNCTAPGQGCMCRVHAHDVFKCVKSSNEHCTLRVAADNFLEFMNNLGLDELNLIERYIKLREAWDDQGQRQKIRLL